MTRRSATTEASCIKGLLAAVIILWQRVSAQGTEATTADVAVSTASRSSPCDEDWSEESGMCYRAFPTPVTFHVAQKICASYGTSLASASNDDRTQAVLNVIKNRNNTGAHWIGLARLCPNDEQIKSSDGTKFDNSKVSNLDTFPRAGILCVLLRPVSSSSGQQQPSSETSKHFALEAAYCENQKPFVCQKATRNLNQSVSDASGDDEDYADSGTSTPSCSDESDMTWCQNDDYCYRVEFDHRRTWSEAEQECRKEPNSHLVSIHSESENSFVLDMINFYSLTREDARFWIGLHNPGLDQGIRWTDLTVQDYSNFSNPMFDQNQDKIPDLPFCAAMYSNRTYRDHGKWLDMSLAQCGSPRSVLKFVCKKPLKPPIAQEGDAHAGLACKPGWLQFGAKCYKVSGTSNDSATTFLEAGKACTDQDSSLVKLNDIYEQMFVYAITSSLDQTQVWINSSSPITYRYDFLFRRPSACPRLTKPVASRWAVVYQNPESNNCADKLAYVCESNATVVATEEQSGNYSSICAGVSGGILYGNSTCFKFMTDSLNQSDAEKTCNQSFPDGHLASIDSVDELQLIYSIAAQKKMSEFWIGLRLNTTDNRTFYWTNGRPVLYSLWADVQSLEKQKMTCAKMVIEDDSDVLSIGAQWENENCNKALPGFICKRTTLPVPEITVTANCEERWTAVGNSCYMKTVPGNMTEGASACRNKEAHLASFHSQAEFDALVSSGVLSDIDNVYIGLRSHIKRRYGKPVTYVWEWTDSSAYNFNNYDKENNQHLFPCTVLNKDRKWEPALCSKSYPALCQKPRGTASISPSSTATPAEKGTEDSSTTATTKAGGETTSEPQGSSTESPATTVETPTPTPIGQLNGTETGDLNKAKSDGHHSLPGAQVALIILVVTLLFGVGGFFAYRRYRRNQAVQRVGQFSQFINFDDDI